MAAHPSGIYYERPTINGAPAYRSLFTKNLDEALKEYYRRRAKGTAKMGRSIECAYNLEKPATSATSATFRARGSNFNKV